MIIQGDKAFAFIFALGILVGWRLCAWHCERKVAQGIKRIMAHLSSSARAEVLDAALPILTKTKPYWASAPKPPEARP